MFHTAKNYYCKFCLCARIDQKRNNGKLNKTAMQAF